MTILVTGAAGFIGSAMSRRLAEMGNKVLAVDNLSPYYSKILKSERVKALLSHSNVDFKVLDLSNLISVQKLFTNRKVDSVVHFAAQAGVRIKMNDWSNYTRDNLTAFSNILLTSAEVGIPKFLFASSSSVYGNSSEEKFNEKITPPSPISLYGTTKLMNELQAASIARTTGMKTRALRFFTVYGPWGRPDMLYFRIASSALSRNPFELLGDGEVRRDFTYIDDVIESSIKLLNELDAHKRGFTDVVNVGGGRPRSMLEILELMSNLAGVDIPYNVRPSNKLDVNRTSADFTYLRSLVGLTPNIQAEAGLAKFYEWASRDDIRNKMSIWANSVKQEM